jgi:hypothetical protein
MYTLVFIKNFGFRATREQVRQFHTMSELESWVKDNLKPESVTRAFSPAGIFIPVWGY